MNHYTHIFPAGHTVIFNKISDPRTGAVCYPDILIRHNFQEAEVSDEALYSVAAAAIAEYGTSHVLIAAASSEEDRKYLINAMAELHAGHNAHIFDRALYDDMCRNLMLTDSMKTDFLRLLTYYSETGGSMSDLLCPFINEYDFPVKNKKEGKQIYEIIRNSVLG